MGISADPMQRAIPTALAASCAFMLPVRTPLNAHVYGTGALTIPQLAKAGLWLNLCHCAAAAGCLPTRGPEIRSRVRLIGIRFLRCPSYSAVERASRDEVGIACSDWPPDTQLCIPGAQGGLVLASGSCQFGWVSGFPS